MHLVNTQGPIGDLLKFFTDNSAIYYRPLGIQLAYWLQQKIFGPQPIYWHGFSLLIHLLNTGLVYALIAKITKNKTVSFLASFLYATSAIHFISLFWLAGIIETLGGVFLIIGFVVRPTAFVTGMEMLFAYFYMHVASKGTLNPLKNGGEAAMLFFAAFLVLMSQGAGKWGIDRKKSR